MNAPSRPPPSVWFPFRQALPNAKLRLFCFAHAGGGAASYLPWSGQLGDHVEVCAVQLPGRETRVGERPWSKMEPLRDRVLDALAPLLDRPFAFFGHSMGALLSFELARALRRRGAPLPRHLFLSAFRAPHLPLRFKEIHALPNDELFVELRQIGGTSEALFEDAELIDLFVPILRADFGVCETYKLVPEPPLDVPMSVSGGATDARAIRAELEGWKQHTTAPFSLRTFEGGHFYLQPERAALLASIRDTLRAITG